MSRDPNQTTGAPTLLKGMQTARDRLRGWAAGVAEQEPEPYRTLAADILAALPVTDDESALTEFWAELRGSDATGFVAEVEPEVAGAVLRERDRMLNEADKLRERIAEALACLPGTHAKGIQAARALLRDATGDPEAGDVEAALKYAWDRMDV